MPRLVPLFDFDGTLVDSDVALTAPWHALGVDPDRSRRSACRSVEACERAGVTVAAYLEHYDIAGRPPFPGVVELLVQPRSVGPGVEQGAASGRRELERLGWTPEVALFSDDFGGAREAARPAARQLDLTADEVVFVGDTAHDRACAAAVGARFALAGWNPCAGRRRTGRLVLLAPSDLLDLL